MRKIDTSDRRKELKMTQQELAERVGTVRSYIAKVEKGETDIQLSSFFRIANALRILSFFRLFPPARLSIAISLHLSSFFASFQ